MQTRINIFLIVAVLVTLMCEAFAPHTPIRRNMSNLFSVVQDPTSMKASELRKELQSYGISTASYFEKSELIEAVEKARREGKKPINQDSESKKQTEGGEMSRQQKIIEEKLKCDNMKVSELKKELESLGISTKSFFEKSEFVQALAEARVDGVNKNSSRSQKKSSRDEPYDPSYRDVIMQKMNDPRALAAGGSIIDIRLK